VAVLLTGAAGFIGFHLSRSLLERGDEVIGVDCISDYYDVSLKESRLALLAKYPKFRFVRLDISDTAGVEKLFKEAKPRRVVNLAAQAGVRYSLTNPHAYISSNIQGFMNILEGCRHGKVEHLVYASSSSVYGTNRKLPFSAHDSTVHPASLYAATKRANELMAHTYGHLYGLPTTGLRFFTVYGPWGRPDMALFLFTRNILEGKPIEVFNYGNHVRDFTYVDDIVKGTVRVLDRTATSDPKWDAVNPDPASSAVPYRIYNIGNNQPVKLTDFIEAIEEATGKKAERKLLPLMPGDVIDTYADVADLERDVDFRPDTPIRDGIREFVRWYREYYKV
jgi:UDP-glucuronate 4-epimerase